LFPVFSLQESEETNLQLSRKRGNKKILFVMSGNEVERKSLNYALSIALRVNRSIEILSFMPDKETREALEEELLSRDMDIALLPVYKASGCIKSALNNYTRNRNDIDFVVIESEATLESECSNKDSKFKEIALKLECPLVIVSKQKTRK